MPIRDLLARVAGRRSCQPDRLSRLRRAGLPGVGNDAPLVVILQTFSLAAIDRSLIEAARNLGATPRETLLRVIIPAAKIGLIIGFVFAFPPDFRRLRQPVLPGRLKPADAVDPDRVADSPRVRCI